MQWLLQLPALFFSIIFHEFMHGYIAYKRGDDTAYLSGRLTLNPLPHIDLFGTIILPAIAVYSGLPFIGWAKPVPVNPYRMQDPRIDMVKVAIAGPFSNFFLALVSAFLYTIFIKLGLLQFALFGPILYMLKFMIYINLGLGFFNLIPVYPLDGSQVLLGLLPYKYLKVYERHLPYGFYIIIFLLIFGLLKYFIVFPMDFTLKIFNLMGLMT